MANVGKNAVYNTAGVIAGMAVLLIATPIYVHFLGLDQFGIFTLIASLTAPLAALNSSVSQAATKFVAKYSAEGSYDRAAAFVRSSCCFNLAFGIAGCVLLFALAPWLAGSLFQMPVELVPTAEKAFRIAGLIWLFTQIGLGFQAVVMGVQRYDTIAFHHAIQPLLMYGAGSVIVVFFQNILAVLGVSLAVSVIYVLIWLLKARQALQGRWLFPAWAGDQARKIWSFSSWQTLNAFVSLAANHADRLLLGALKGATPVGVYGIAISVQSRLTLIIWSLLSVLFPAASAAKEGEGERVVLQYGWIFSVAGIVLYGTLFVAGEDLLILWLGQEVGSRAAPVLRALLVVAFLGLPSAVMYQYLLGQGLTKWLSLGNTATSAVTIAAAWILINGYGLLGAAWSGAAGLVLTRPFFHWWVLKRLDALRRGAAVPFLRLYSCQISGLIGGGLGWLLLHSIEGQFESRWLRLLLVLATVPIAITTGTLWVEKHFFKHAFPWSAAAAFLRRIKNAASRLAPAF